MIYYSIVNRHFNAITNTFETCLSLYLVPTTFVCNESTLLSNIFYVMSVVSFSKKTCGDLMNSDPFDRTVTSLSD